jgi:hypothetical protein
MEGSRSVWVRRCPACDLNVYNLSELTRKDALALLERTEGRACVQLWRRADGTVITADCWDRIRAARRRGLLAAIGTTIVMLPLLVWAVIQGARNLRALVLPSVEELPPAKITMGQVREPLYQPRPRWMPREQPLHGLAGAPIYRKPHKKESLR